MRKVAAAVALALAAAAALCAAAGIPTCLTVEVTDPS